MAGNPFMRFYRELKRRKVIRVAVAYLIAAWLLVEVASVQFPELLLPDWSVRLVIALLVIGFPIALILAWAFDLTPEGAATPPETDEPPPAESASKKSGSVTDSGIRSIAVLPFSNLSNDPENEYFSEGISDEMLNMLCKLPQLTVASRTSSYSSKGKNVDLATIASRLGVDAILEGSVRRSGDRVRITAQLIDGHADRHLWSENFDRQLTDVFAVQDEIAHKLVDALELSLTPDQQHLIQKTATTKNVDAYDFYLRGRFYVERAEIDSGLRMFENAIELDRDYALAWAGAADCHSWRCMWFESTPFDVRRADECSQRALQLAPELAEAHASRSYAMTAIGNYEEAEAAFKAAVERDPQLYEAYYYVGRAYFAQGKYREAADAFAQARNIRPDDPTAAALRSTALGNLGAGAELEQARQESIQVGERHLSLNPDDGLTWSRVANVLIL
ncbi:MAG: tetratricopeptide repeat protein, partial [Planctomycetes bacterium]|nr:tetratricopeptide repeat protein [Planctomycetota bacterium]